MHDGSMYVYMSVCDLCTYVFLYVYLVCLCLRDMQATLDVWIRTGVQVPSVPGRAGSRDEGCFAYASVLLIRPCDSRMLKDRSNSETLRVMLSRSLS